jgi:hypothetical protein
LKFSYSALIRHNTDSLEWALNTHIHMYTDYRDGYWCKQEGKYEYIFKRIYKKRPTFFCCHLICSFPLSRQMGWASSTRDTKRRKKKRERGTHIDGGGFYWRKIRRQQKTTGPLHLHFLRRINHIRGRYRFMSGFKGTYSVRLYRIGKWFIETGKNKLLSINYLQQERKFL